MPVPNPTQPSEPGDRDTALVSQRTAVIGLLGLLTGLIAGVLTALAGRSLPEAVLVGLAATAAGTKFFHWLIT